jgi:hypothetical protein
MAAHAFPSDHCSASMDIATQKNSLLVSKKLINHDLAISKPIWTCEAIKKSDEAINDAGVPT